MSGPQDSQTPPRTSTQIIPRKPTILGKLGRLLIGRARNPNDESLFHTLSLIAFFAWVGLGADGLSSLCYGPEEAFLNLHGHLHLSIFVAIASVLTVLIISAGYSQLIEAFPSGGGGYLVASKMLSPSVGVVCGCALLVDYILTITISVASSAEFIFSFLSPEQQWLRIYVAIFGLVLLTLLNLRGVKESVVPLVPVFLLFIFTYVLAIGWAIATRASTFPDVVAKTVDDIRESAANPAIGIFGMVVLVLKAYSTGAGTYTGIEAVSNGLQILREPRVKTGKRTMRYMSISLAVGVMGLMVAYLLMGVDPAQMFRDEGGHLVKIKTLNALLFESVSSTWGVAGQVYVWAALGSSAAILLVAAQAGFLGGPRVAA
ncbi:MAG: amino acid permease, partial [Planctomycetota bacterium]|nr:amino acid permease [Planctomycetota bacterium]